MAAAVLALLGVSIIIWASNWRGFEATVSAHVIQFVTGRSTQAIPARHLLILYKDTSVESIFVLTSECTVAYLAGALLIGASPLMLLRPLSPWRTMAAVVLGGSILILGNISRLVAIGATVSTWGLDPGLVIAHTYLGSLLTVLATCAAGIAFAAVLLGRRIPRHAAL
ncbi:MAG: hypothetical protein ABIU87_11790 [Ornithinibacter sp.]